MGWLYLQYFPWKDPITSISKRGKVSKTLSKRGADADAREALEPSFIVRVILSSCAYSGYANDQQVAKFIYRAIQRVYSFIVMALL